MPLQPVFLSLEEAGISCYLCHGSVYYNPPEDTYLYVCSDCGHEWDSDDQRHQGQQRYWNKE